MAKKLEAARTEMGSITTRDLMTKSLHAAENFLLLQRENCWKECKSVSKSRVICGGINTHFELCHNVQQAGRQASVFTMAPKGGTLVLLLIVACAAMGKHQHHHMQRLLF